MADQMSDPITRCPWCSAPLPAPEVERCPACEAVLTAVPDAPAEIKGVTTLDTEAILRARSAVSQPRGNRLLSFFTGDGSADMSAPADPGVFAPPPDDVRREMPRLQIEAERADLVAETVALKADELARRGIHISDLGGDEPVAGPGDATPPSVGSPEGAVEAGHEGAPSVAPEAAPPDAGARDAATPQPEAAPEAAPEGGWPAELTPEESQASEPEPESRG